MSKKLIVNGDIVASQGCFQTLSGDDSSYSYITSKINIREDIFHRQLILEPTNTEACQLGSTSKRFKQAHIKDIYTSGLHQDFGMTQTPTQISFSKLGDNNETGFTISLGATAGDGSSVRFDLEEEMTTYYYINGVLYLNFRMCAIEDMDEAKHLWVVHSSIDEHVIFTSCQITVGGKNYDSNKAWAASVNSMGDGHEIDIIVDDQFSYPVYVMISVAVAGLIPVS